jgi:putative proteasome-type protease
VTYCLALRLDEGLIFLSDTRTNAGVDNVGTYRKLHVFAPAPDRVFVLQSAGNLGTTQQVLDMIGRDLDAGGEQESLASVCHMFEAALYIGRLSQSIVQQHRGGLGTVGADATASFILGGQIAGDRPEITLVYPEGNYIRPSDERPFLQIGESKYGKFMLELAVRARVGMEDAIKIALSSMVSTARANLSVGPPYDLGLYHNGSLTINEHRIESDSPYLQALQDAWVSTLIAAVDTLPALPADLVD